jgi:predicted ATP-dependent protease
VQAIGGVNEKIEGFYRACALGELNCRAGVIIPGSNARHLMLDAEVVEAMRTGQFMCGRLSASNRESSS